MTSVTIAMNIGFLKVEKKAAMESLLSEAAESTLTIYGHHVRGLLSTHTHTQADGHGRKHKERAVDTMLSRAL